MKISFVTKAAPITTLVLQKKPEEKGNLMVQAFIFTAVIIAFY